MKLIKPFAMVLATLALSGMAIPSSAYDGDWKRGRIYYRSVCTSCHVALPIGQVNPSSKTMAEWKSYLQADKHAKGKDSMKQYLSKAYRASIKTQNKAAEKFADVPEAELYEDLKAFVIRGAKDGDSPASCS